MDMQSNPTTNPATPENKVPEPPALEIDIRTMESDIKAFREGGGEAPTQGMQESFASQRDAVQPAPAYTGPEKPLFEIPATPVVPVMPTAPAQPTLEPASSGTLKMILITIGIIIGIVGLGLLGYFVVFPYLFELLGK